MNSIIIVIFAVIWIILGYRFYGRFVEKRMKINDKISTPAVKSKNRFDFSPSKKKFLIGHHFSSIAGAGPVIGPILAVSYFGWLPVAIWVLVGSVFIGAMHDYVALIASVRNKAKGVASITRKYLNRRAGWVFGLMIWITLILIVTVFTVSSAESIIQKPSIIIPLITITIVALFLGIGVEKYKLNPNLWSVIGIIISLASIWLVEKINISVFISSPEITKIFWISAILLYAFVASVMPIWLLLRPRGYLSSIQIVLILLLAFIGILIVHPEVSAPSYIPNAPFPIWPILFVTVACGAISGFHGIVSSGTTSKQLAKESHGKSIGYGGMLMEGFLAILVTTIIVSGLKWGINIPGGFQNTLEKGWIILFSDSFGNIVGNMGIPFITISIASILGAFMVNQFILTSVDTSSRLGRFVFTETLFPKMKNKYLVTLIVILPAWALAVTNSYQSLWRLFGTSNQLIASISLIGIASYFISKKIKTKFITIPAILVLSTTMSALIYLTFRAGGYFTEGKISLAIISLVMFILGAVVAYEGIKEFIKKK